MRQHSSSDPSNWGSAPEKKVYFLGVTTAKSSINHVFPSWMKVIGRPEIRLQGQDFKIHDDPLRYREMVKHIKSDPLSLGALVTTHKIDLYNAAKDLFDYLDPLAQTCGEISCISKIDGRLEGHAKDPISAGLSLEAILPDGYFGSSGAEVLCFGSGGSGVAIALHLINQPKIDNRPGRFVFINRSQWRLDHAQQMVQSTKTDIRFEYICNENPEINDQILESMPDHSLVINATGMGKDTPGSPVSWHAKFPISGVVWEFNYRGELDFFHQALAQKESHQLVVEDGWVYFLHGWIQVIAQVLHIDLDLPLFNTLSKAAEIVRK